MRVIRAFCREQRCVEEFEENNQALTHLNLFVGRLSALLNPLTYVLINIATVVLIQRAGVQVNLGSLPQGQVVALYNYMLQIIVEVIKLAALIITLNKSLACAKRVSGVLDIKTSMTYPARTPSFHMEHTAAPAVAFDDVSFTYQGAGAPSLSHISFSVMSGETVGIIGGTGSGKSTLVHLIPRFYDATEGSIRLNGCPIQDFPHEILCRKIGIVPQRALLFQGSIRENMKWGNEHASDEALWQALTCAQAREIVENKPDKLDFHLEQNGRNLSG